MYDKDMFQTVPFRLNLNHDEDALVWKLLLSTEEEPRKSLFGNRSKFIKWVLVKYARDEFDFDEAKGKLDSLKKEFIQSAQYELQEAVKKESDSIMAMLEKAVELAVTKAVTEVLKVVVAGGVSVGLPVVTTAEQSNKAVQTEVAVPKMGVLPEVDGNDELPTSALSFLNGF
ncbi:MAG TPA: hypothetical protein VJY54_09945 [Lachnospiraceae bacterium]|nr:hypothetical protein [Lachnospiraceae bacterium]